MWINKKEKSIFRNVFGKPNKNLHGIWLVIIKTSQSQENIQQGRDLWVIWIKLECSDSGFLCGAGGAILFGDLHVLYC